MSYHIFSVGLEAEIIGCEQYCFVFAKNDDGDVAQFMCDSDGKIVDEGYLDPIPEELAYLLIMAAEGYTGKIKDCWEDKTEELNKLTDFLQQKIKGFA